MKTIANQKTAARRALAFTLIELLVVISIMGVLAGMSIPVLAAVKAQQYKKVGRGELERLEVALENYKAKYGAYPPGNALNNPLLPQLYYELSGTTINGGNYATLDGSSTILAGNVQSAYGVGGFVNCTKGSGDDGVKAQDFLPGFKPNQYGLNVTNNGVPTTILITSAGGPDITYQPLNAPNLNPFRYVYPGVNNPNSYDLWVQLQIRGKKYLICNWSQQAVVNSPLP
jgi:prepilin-type N-terminal cleavage/methylation domain-containing protein